MPTAEHRSPWAVLKGAGEVPSRFRAWWRRRSEFEAMDRRELEHIAGDLGMTAAELEDLAARGPHAADQLRERMHIMGITGADVAQVTPGLMRDLERTCADCQKKGRCGRDLAGHPGDRAWEGYCPNAIVLTAVKTATHHAPGGRRVD